MGWLWSMMLGAMFAQAEEPEALQQAISVVQQRLPGQDSDVLRLAALQGITAYLNDQMGAPTNGVLTAGQYAQIAAHQRGDRIGLGALYEVVGKQGLLLDHVFDGGPAARAGLVRGDMVVALNNHPFTGMSADEIFAIANIEAVLPAIALDVRRDGGTKRFEIQRSTYRVPSVSIHPTTPNCIELLFFGEDTAETLRALLGKMDPGEGLVIDLRDNQGGLLEEAVEAAGLFLSPGTVVAQQTTAEGTASLVASGSPAWDGQLIILLNERTTGIAEMFTAALWEHRGVHTVGTQTGGLAREASYYPLDAGLVLQLADTLLRAPSGRSWEGAGLMPDTWVEPVSNSPSGRIPDVQLSTALGLLSEP